ncbi:helix-turn-helix transcriptional regulator [Lachnospiraceae bacterium 62-26]
MLGIDLRHIKDIREDHDLSQKELAKILNISQRTYSHYENGTRKIPLDVLVELADFYGCSTDYLLGRAKEKNKTSPPSA